MIDPSLAYLAGRLLVAMPGIGDLRFERAVILICSHDADHAMGLVVNRPVEGLTLSRVLKQLGVETHGPPIRDLAVMGGPVETERGFVLHTDDYPAPAASLNVPGGLALTATREILVALAARGGTPRCAVMALGYAGWEGGQLEREIRENVWLTAEPDESLLFGDDHEHKWTRALAKIGVSADRLSTQGGLA